ncbi:MAG TPA: hypothetical protein VK893_14665 [Pyrinomonadaceae bacterium]|nr:hypothetical protein [Pyrinomonadaceae bacterium]
MKKLLGFIRTYAALLAQPAITTWAAASGKATTTCYRWSAVK